jgi:hypothetical protein
MVFSKPRATFHQYRTAILLAVAEFVQLNQQKKR